jgi:hypothetical protein
MYKIGIALMAIFAVMVIPAQGSSENGRPTYYGMGTIVLNDSFGNEVFSQTLHNRVVNTGESFIIAQTFQNGTSSVADTNAIGSICVTEAAGFTPAEGDDAATFDTNTTIGTGNECKEDTTVTESTQGQAVIGPLTFAVSNLDAAGETITGIGVCQATTANDNDFGTCASNGLLFAEVDTTDVTLNTGETVQITYTFDITSSGT